jgi:DNA-binding NtrC family response regulator
MLIRVLVHLVPERLAERVGAALAGGDVVVSTSRSRDDLWRRLGDEAADLVVLNRDACVEPLEQVIPLLRRTPELPEVVVLATEEDSAERARLQSVGSFAVVFEGLPDESLRATLGALVRRRREQRVQGLGVDRPAFRLSDFVSRSDTMRELLATARRVAASDSSVLLLGETGTGKEWLARALHEEGLRSAGPFIAVNCSALPESLLESELFGHEKGAFTGAIRARRGLCELAHRGTLFLDEIGDMSPHLQVKLLRVLQERRIQRIGSEGDVSVDLRIMAATNRDLEQAMHNREFRRDLYYRLSVVTLTLPPLRERHEDVPLLIETYLARFRAQLGRHDLEVSERAMEALSGYSWPGNVRELINVIERAVLLASGDRIDLDDLPPAVAGAPDGGSEDVGASAALAPGLWRLPMPEAVARLTADFERQYLDAALRAGRGRINEVARQAGIETRTLYNKMKLYGLRKEAYR